MALTFKIAKNFWKATDKEFREKYLDYYKAIYINPGRISAKKYRVLTGMWGRWLQQKMKVEEKKAHLERIKEVRNYNITRLFQGHEALKKLR